MAGEKTLAELDAQIDADIRVNGNREITPPKHNSIEKNIAKSSLNKKDGGLVMEALTGYSSLFTISDNKHFTHKKYVDDEIDAALVEAYYPGLTANTTVDVDGNYFRLVDGSDELFRVEPGGTTIGETLFLDSVLGDPTIDFAPATPGSYMFQRVGTALQFVANGIFKVLSNSGVRFDTTAEDDVSLTYSGGIWTFWKEAKFLGNMALGFSVDYASGSRVFFICNADAEPVSAPSDGCLMWGNNDKIKTYNDFVLKDQGLAFYHGDEAVNGSWRRRIDGDDLIEERREAGVWVEKNRIAA